MSNQLTVKDFFNRDDVKKKFSELMGERASSFMTSVMQVVASNDLLKDADPPSIYQSAMVSATLNLPINNNLGFAYIVPYKSKQKDGTYKVVAQFQIGYKGLIQLSQRSGQFATMNVTDVREGEVKSHNRLTDEVEFQWIQDQKERLSKNIIGYVSYFRLLNGFEKLNLMYMDELEAHGKRFSQTFKRGFGLWKDDFDSMSKKTAMKLLLSKYAPLSVDMQKAVVADQSVIHDADTMDVEYIDNDPTAIDEPSEDNKKATDEAIEKLKAKTSGTGNLNDLKEDKK
jgi:recombination protein RecT